MIQQRTPALDLPQLEMAVAFSVSYKVRHTVTGAFNVLDSSLADLIGKRPVLVVVDEAIWAARHAEITAYVRSRLDGRGFITLPGTEATKSLSTVSMICDKALEVRLPRDGVLMAVGGGTVMDVAGFSASIYRRGIGYVRVPTTLVGMIDVAVGIKQGINVGQRKNALGSFYPPLGIINDQTLLANLPRRQLACGISESLKVALVCDERLFSLLEKFGALLIDTGFQEPEDVAQEVLHRSEAAMINQLSLDIYETTRRRLVDFGHTFSPTIESASGFEIPHGEAVAMDMLLSSLIGVRTGTSPDWLPLHLARVMQRVGLPIWHETMSVELMSAALEDSRLHRAGNLNLVVPVGIGAGTFIQEVSKADLASALLAIQCLRR